MYDMPEMITDHPHSMTHGTAEIAPEQAITPPANVEYQTSGELTPLPEDLAPAVGAVTLHPLTEVNEVHKQIESPNKPSVPTEGSPAQDDPSVGNTLSSMWQASPLSLHTLAERVGSSAEELAELFKSNAYPSISKVLIPVMRELDVPPDQGLNLIDRYRGEIDPTQLPKPEVPKVSDASDLVGVPTNASLKEEIASPPTEQNRDNIDPPEKPPTDEGTAEAGDEEPETGSGHDSSESLEVDEDEPSPPYAPGQLREVVASLEDGFAAAGHNLEVALTPRQREALQVMNDPEAPNMAAVAERLGVTQASASKLAQRVIESGVERAKQLGIQLELPEHRGTVRQEPNPETVGGTLWLAQQRSGLTQQQIADRAGLSVAAIDRFFFNHTYPRPQRVLIPLMRVLNIPKTDAQALAERYEAEREAVLIARKEAANTPEESPSIGQRHEAKPMWAPGQVREALVVLDRANEGGIAAVLPPRAYGQKQVATLVATTNLTYAQIAERLGVSTAHVTRMAGFALDSVLKKLPPEELPPGMPQPSAEIAERPPDTVQGEIDLLIRGQPGLSLAGLAEQAGISVSKLQRFLRGQNYPNWHDVQAILHTLGVPEEKANAMLERYRADRWQRLAQGRQRREIQK